MEFEYDPAKSAANRAKHGLDFEAAQALWEVPGLTAPAPFRLEERLQRTAQLDGRFWTAIYTVRGSRIRIISVRRARRKEIEAYVRHAGS